jgi:hypothetical protein
MGYESEIPAIEGPQSYALARTATGISLLRVRYLLDLRY